MALTKKQREQLRIMFGGKCAYCGCGLPEKGWHADHINPVQRVLEQDMKAKSKGIFKLKSTGDVYHPDRDVFENYYPSCAPCNLFKANWSLEGFRRQLSEQTTRARASSVNFRNAERFGMISITNDPIVFYFEKFEKLTCGE